MGKLDAAVQNQPNPLHLVEWLIEKNNAILALLFIILYYFLRPVLNFFKHFTNVIEKGNICHQYINRMFNLLYLIIGSIIITIFIAIFKLLTI